MKKIRTILTVDKSNAFGVEGKITAETSIGDKCYGRSYLFGGGSPSFDQMLQMAFKATRNFLRKEMDLG